MPATALFGNSSSGPGSTGGNKHLVEMRAGKMNLKGKMVYPDKRKGLLYVYQGVDSLMHFCWQDRSSGIVEDDLIIFPDDCDFIKVPQCTTGRVYLLKFKSSNRKFFFWLQEPSADKDDENCKKINDYLNNPSASIQNQGGADNELQSLLNNMSQSQLMQLFSGGNMGLSNLLGTMSRPSTTGTRTSSNPPAVTHRTIPATPTTAASVVSTPPNNPPAATTEAPRANRNRTDYAPSTIQLSDLQNFLQEMAPSPGASAPQSVDLSTALTADALSGIMSNTEALEQLQSHLPAVDGNVQEQLRSTLQSPQFQQAVSQFSSALETGQLGPVVSQLAVNSEAISAAAQGNMQEFLKALENNGGSESEKDKKDNKSAKKDDKKDDDEGMQLG